MRRSWIRNALTLAFLAGGAAWLGAHVRLEYSVNGQKLIWTSPSNIPIVINSAGSEDIPDVSDELAVRSSLSAWNDVTNTTASFASPSVSSRTDWDNEGVRLVMFDESNSSGFFPNGSGIVAITPVLFFTTGEIIDADVLYNGRQFQFTTEGAPGRFDVEDVGTHELGHLLGLDHTGWAGGTMFPFVDPTVILHRSLSLDEVAGIRQVYPSGTFGRINGTVERASDSSSVSGAHVVAVDSTGRTAAARITNGSGNFSLASLAADTYTVYATPWEGPVSAANLGTQTAIQTDFESTVFGTVVVGAGATVSMGTLQVGADVSTSLGRTTDILPLRATSGETTALTLRGSGLDAGSSLTPSDPAVTIAVTAWSGTTVSFTATVPPGAAPGHVGLTATDALGNSSILPAAIEVTPVDPTVTQIVPATMNEDGGTDLTISGSDFQPGSRVVIGDRIYRDGTDATVTPNQITLTAGATLVGLHDVVVIGPTGIEGRINEGMVVSGEVFAFPAGGDLAGGTQVTVSGGSFAGATYSVTLDGVPQPGVIVDGSTLTFTTQPVASAATTTLEVLANGTPLASTAFTYAEKPDPTVTGVDPNDDSERGGKQVNISGTGFTPQTRVRFGVNATTGAGGSVSSSVQFVSDTLVRAIVPPFSPGVRAIAVEESDSGQGDILAGAFTYKPVPTGGGGGCAAGIDAGPLTWRRVLANAGWILVLFSLLGLRSRRLAKAVPARVS